MMAWIISSKASASGYNRVGSHVGEAAEQCLSPVAPLIPTKFHSRCNSFVHAHFVRQWKSSASEMCRGDYDKINLSSLKFSPNVNNTDISLFAICSCAEDQFLKMFLKGRERDNIFDATLLCKWLLFVASYYLIFTTEKKPHTAKLSANEIIIFLLPFWMNVLYIVNPYSLDLKTVLPFI